MRLSASSAFWSRETDAAGTDYQVFPKNNFGGDMNKIWNDVNRSFPFNAGLPPGVPGAKKAVLSHPLNIYIDTSSQIGGLGIPVQTKEARIEWFMREAGKIWFADTPFTSFNPILTDTPPQRGNGNIVIRFTDGSWKSVPYFTQSCIFDGGEIPDTLFRI